MSVFLVTWNLNHEKPNYAAARARFLKAIDAYPNFADSGLETVRFVEFEPSANELYAKLRSALDDDDRIFVCGLGDHQGWVDDDVWKWINARI